MNVDPKQLPAAIPLSVAMVRYLLRKQVASELAKRELDDALQLAFDEVAERHGLTGAELGLHYEFQMDGFRLKPSVPAEEEPTQ